MCTIFWDAMLHCLVEVHIHFGGTDCLHLRGYRYAKKAMIMLSKCMILKVKAARFSKTALDNMVSILLT
jgi:hypothetical protein